MVLVGGGIGGDGGGDGRGGGGGSDSGGGGGWVNGLLISEGFLSALSLGKSYKTPEHSQDFFGLWLPPEASPVAR